MTDKKISIVVPVYADWPSLKTCIESLIQYVAIKHRILLINDSGPEADLLEKNVKELIKDHKNLIYYRNPKNLGFVGTCNRAVFELDKTDNNILLLNSDTKVTSGFLEEMVVVMQANKKIGSVSPRSNNATIATVPLSAISQKGITPKESFIIFEKIKIKLPRYSVVPTAHGFCMLIRRSLIKKYGLFDDVFGKGYGEENDFCMRVNKHGYISVLANHAYVYHLEARSFTMATKVELLHKNRTIIDKRYPQYTHLVRDYVKKALVEEKRIEESLGVEVPSVKTNKAISRVIRKIKMSVGS